MDDCITRQECRVCQDKYDEININQNRRITALEADMKQLQDLTISVNRMAVSLETMTKELSKQGQKLEAIEAEPGKKWEQAVSIVISVVITAVATFFLARMGM
jgi:hypothetical protein